MNHLRTPSFAWAIGLAAAALAWPGCSSDEAESVAPTFRYASAIDFCNEVGNKACSGAVVDGCGLAKENPNDIARCASAVRSHCLDGSFEPARRKNNADGFYQGAQAEACLQSIESAHLDGVLTASDMADINARCDLVFSPSNAIGGACVEKADCAPSLNAASQVDCFYQKDTVTNALAGKCALVKPVQPGSACTELGSVCVDDGQRDLFCNGQNCVENVSGVAEPCVGLNSCGANERCLPAQDAPAGSPTTTCQPKIGNDQPCSRNEECISGVCGTRLDQTTGQPVRLCSIDVKLNNADIPACRVYRQ
ncbi:MAG TPA: hypothetical protein VFS43_46315 [Polyangiaceae bacterium]|nr:hypothetical protein [Polyangiaceae bacterium]